MDLHATVRIPSWVPRIPDRVAVVWGLAYAIWAFVKGVGGIVPKMQCGQPPFADLAAVAMVLEVCVGFATAQPLLRRWGALAGFTLNLCFVGFAFGAHARHLPWEHCGCFFAGIDAPWLPWHAIAGGVLSLPFLAVFLHAERGRTRMFGGAPLRAATPAGQA